MKIIKGDLIALAKTGEFDIIVHGANCLHTMGAGIAKEIKKHFPEAWQADLKTKIGPQKLGTYSGAIISDVSGKRLVVINLYTQKDYRGTGCKIDYEATRIGLRRLKQDIMLNILTDKIIRSPKIGYPRIGAGLAGGDWSVISKIIDEELQGLDHTLVEYEKG